MSLLSTLKSLLGLGGSERRDEPTSVTVEREPDPATERAVTEPVSESEDDETAAGDRDENDAETAAESAPNATAETDEGTDASAAAADPVQSVSGIGPAYAERLAEAGIDTTGDLASADAAALAEETGISEKRIDEWIDRVRSD